MHTADSLTHSLNNFLCRQNKANLPFWASLRRPHSVVCLHLETLWAFLWCQLREKKVIFDVWLGEWCQKVTLGKSLADNFSTVKFSLTFLIWLTIMSTSVLEYPCVYLDIHYAMKFFWVVYVTFDNFFHQKMVKIWSTLQRKFIAFPELLLNGRVQTKT